MQFDRYDGSHAKFGDMEVYSPTHKSRLLTARIVLAVAEAGIDRRCGWWATGRDKEMAKFDHSKASKAANIATHGYEPIAKDYVEFPSLSKQRSRPRKLSTAELEWRDGSPDPSNFAVRTRWLNLIEATLRRGETPTGVPKSIFYSLRSEIEAIRQNPEVRRAYRDAVNRKR